MKKTKPVALALLVVMAFCFKAPSPSYAETAGASLDAPSTTAADAGNSEATELSATYAHTVTAEQSGITFTIGWNDAPAGSETTFHVTQTGGSSSAKARMDAPTYWDTDVSQESVCDPSRPAWGSYYELGENGYDFSFELTASGTYRINFYFMDTDSGIWYLRTTVVVEINDAARPSVTQIVNNAVAQCRAETSSSEYDMALWLHDWALDQLEYDHSLNYCSAESGLTRGLGTCESYQRIYVKLLNAAGIANGRIEGNGHTWNAARIDGKWCQMDLTWDDTNDNWYGDLDQRHLYFGLTDELMAIAHSDHAKNYQADDYAYRSVDLSNNYFVRSGKADEWAKAYTERIQRHLDAREESFSIDADNGSFPPSISGIQNAIVAYAMNQQEWSVGGALVALKATSNVTMVSGREWTAKYVYEASYSPIEPSHEQLLPDGMYSIYTALNQAKALDVRMGSTSDGANVQIWSDHGGDQQKVRLSFQSDGSYLITFVHSGKALTAEALRDGANVSQSESIGSDLQRWIIERSDSGFTIRTKAGNQWLNIRLASQNDGTNVQTWSNGGAKETLFNLVPTEANALPNGRYAIRSGLDRNKVIDIRMASQNDSANAQLWSDYGSANQSVDLRRQADSTYVILFAHSGKALTADSPNDGANVSQAEYCNSSLQHWQLRRCGEGYIVRVAAATQYLNIRLANARDGANVQTWSNGGVKETIFLFEKR